MLHSNEGVFRKQRLHKLLIFRLLNPEANFYYGLVDSKWFFLIMDFQIQNAYFELRIGESGMVFSIMDV